VVADPGVGVEDRELQPALREVVAGRQARLPAPMTIVSIRSVACCPSPAPWLLGRVRRRPGRPVAMTHAIDGRSAPHRR
jgi:hypothetical protein